MLVFGGVYEWHRKLNYVSPFHLYNFCNPPRPTLHIEFVLETFHPPPFPSFHKRGAGGLTQPRTVRFFCDFFNCWTAQLPTPNWKPSSWSFMTEAIGSKPYLPVTGGFVTSPSWGQATSFSQQKIHVQPWPPEGDVFRPKTMEKSGLKKNGRNDTVIRFGCMVIPIKKMRLWNWAILESRMCTISETMMQRIMRLNIPPESLIAIFIGLLVSMLYFIISFWIGSWSEVSWNRNTYSYASMISTIYLHIHTMSF